MKVLTAAENGVAVGTYGKFCVCKHRRVKQVLNHQDTIGRGGQSFIIDR
jgi:hypothetical protein